MVYQRGRSKRVKSCSEESFEANEGRPRPVKDKPQPSPERLEQRARNVLLYQLAKSAKSKHQLREILEKREIPTEIAEPILERFTEVGLIDDQAFAATLVSSRRAFRGLSKSAIRQELKTKGVEAQVIETALETVSSEDELQSAQELALKRFNQMAHLDKTTRDRRLAGFLQRKGYSSSITFAAIRWAESQELK